MQVIETVQISSVSTSLKKDIHVCDGDHCREERSFMTEVGKYYILVSCQSELRRSACAVL